MSLPMKAVDRLFERMAATYGAQWLRMWDGVPIHDVKTLWGHELSVYTSRLDTVAWALENLPPRCPNVIEFKLICRQAPAPETPKLPELKADPARLAAELARLAEVKKAVKESGGYDGKAWAKRLIARSEAGERIRPISLQFARVALRMHLPSGGEHA